MATRLPLPLTVKVRLGESASKINVDEVVALLEQAGAAAVTIHGRRGEAPSPAGQGTPLWPAGRGSRRSCTVGAPSLHTHGAAACGAGWRLDVGCLRPASAVHPPLQDHGAAVQEARGLGAD